MSMRIFSRAEFFKELERLGLTPTEETTETHQIWQARDGQFIPVPNNQDKIPDYILDALLAKVGQLYQCASPLISKTYTVNEGADIIPLQANKKP